MDFSGVWVPLVTPFRGGQVDEAALARLVGHCAAQGVAGFMPCGSTGEAAMLEADEQLQVLRAVLQAARGLPVVAGLSGVQPDRVAARARELAAQLPLAGFLVSAPAYVRPAQRALVDYFFRVADATPLPLVAYDVPARTGVRIEAATLLALAEHPRIRAVKDCSGDRAAAEALLADGRLALLAGNDDELFDQLARGAVGGVTATAQLAPAAFVAFHRLMAAHRLPEARAAWRRLLPVVQGAFAEPNPMSIKAELARQGWLANELRAPMVPARDASALAEAVRRLDDVNRP